MASPPLLRKKRMLCAKSPLPVPDAYCLCEGGPILPHQLSDAASLRRAKRLNLKPPRLKLRACYSKLLGYAALSCARLIKPINGACLEIVGICSSMLSHLVPLSWAGVKYPNVREQRRSSTRTKQRDNPRPFFRFHPLVSKDEDAYQMLMKGVKGMIGKDVDVRGFEVDEELYDLDAVSNS